MKVVFATGIFPPDIGGPAASVPLLAEAWSARGHEVTVVTYADAPSVAGNDPAYRVVRISRTLPVWRRYPAFFMALWRASAGPGSIFAQDGVASGVPALIVSRLRRRRLIVRIAGDFAWERAQVAHGYRESLETFQRDRRLPLGLRVIRALQRSVFRHAHLAVAPSRYLADVLRGWGVGENRIRVIHNGVVLPDVIPAHGTHPRRIVASARLVPWKNIDVLIKAMPGVLARVPDATLLIVGDGPERERLEALSAAPMLKGKVSFAGRMERKDLLTIIAESAVFALPSSYEGFSHQLVEAFACGAAVVASRAGGNTELVADGKNGLLVEPGDVVGLSKALIRFLEEPAFAEACGREAAKGLAGFTVDTQIARTTEAVLGRPGLRVVLVSRDGTAADPSSRTAARMRAYGERVDFLHVVCLARQEPSSMRLSPRVQVDVVDARTALRHPLALTGAVKDAAIASQASLVVAQDPFEAGVSAAAAAWSVGVPLLVEEHGGVYLSPHWRREKIKHRLLHPLGLLVMGRAAGLRAVSAKIEADLRRRWPKMPIARIPVYTEPIACYREGAPYVFGYVGRFVPQKKLEMLLSAFASVVRTRPEARLLMVGAGPSEAALRAEAEALGIGDHVTWRPYSERIVDVFKEIGTLVLSSRYEGWARVVPEAMSCGIPVVMTDVGCAGELLRNGVEGYVTPIDDAGILAQAMLKISDPHQHALMSAAARRRSETSATPEDLAGRLIGFWKEVAGL